MSKSKVKKSPSRADLFGWFLWEKLASVPISVFDEPATLKDWLEEFESKGLNKLHDHFYDKYEKFMEVYCDADETGGDY